MIAVKNIYNTYHDDTTKGRDMVDFTTIYNLILVGSFLFFFEQFAIILSMYRDRAGWHFRFARVKGHKNLRPVVATWKITTVIFFISIFVIPAVGLMFSDMLIGFVGSLEYSFSIMISGLVGLFVFIWHYLVGRGWNVAQGVMLVTSITTFAIPFVLTYYPTTT